MDTEKPDAENTDNVVPDKPFDVYVTFAGIQTDESDPEMTKRIMELYGTIW